MGIRLFGRHPTLILPNLFKTELIAVSTKVSEKCPQCTTDVMPRDKTIRNEKTWKYLWLWFYECESCEWVWANSAQRKHNEREYDRSCSQRVGMYF